MMFVLPMDLVRSSGSSCSLLDGQHELSLCFGKHRGWEINQVDDAYLRWMLRSFPESSPWQKAAATVLTVRGTTQREAVHNLVNSLKSCSLRRDLQQGRRIHTAAVETGIHANAYVATALIKMYSKCGIIADAHLVFDSIRKPDVVCWTALLLGYAENGKGDICLDLFVKMQAAGYEPDSVTFVAALKACTSLGMNEDGSAKDRGLKRGREIHMQIGYHLDLFLQNTLIDMYAKCGSMVDALQVFESIQKPDVVSWNALLSGYVENGEGQVSLELFSKMKADGYEPSPVTFVAALKACTSLVVNADGKAQCLATGSKIHLEIGDRLDLHVQSTLVDMYAKCGRMLEARCVFDTIKKPNVVAWNALLLGYAENEEGHVSLELFSKMNADGFVPDSVTYVAAFKACSSLAVNGDIRGKAHGLECGRQIHLQIGVHLDLKVQNTLIDMYAKCGSMASARQVLDSIQKPDVVSWTSLLLGYAENGDGHISLELFSKMKADGYVPNSVTYLAALKACKSLAVAGSDSDKARGLRTGSEIHSEIGNHLNPHLQSTLIDMYAKCGSMLEARRVFDSIRKPDVICWNSLLLGYAENGEAYTALALFSKMKADGYAPNTVTYVAALKACSSLAVNGHGSDGLEQGRAIHLEAGDHLTAYVQSTLIDMYGKCHSMVEARQVFDSIERPDIVSWTALLLGYAENDEGHAALDLWAERKADGCVPNSVTYFALLKACGSAGSLALGRQFHSQIGDFTPLVVTGLVDFYAKCGSVVEARAVFDLHLETGDVMRWNALLAGYSSCGDTGSVFSLLEAMQRTRFRPDAVTFVNVLVCCNHAGLVEKARHYLQAMPVQYGVTPDVFHYNCMVDVLGRANQLEEAVSVLRSMPCSPDAVTWNELLAACRRRKNVEIARVAFQSLVQMGWEDASAYVLMAHVSSSRGISDMG